jgi:hypothetical protein
LQLRLLVNVNHATRRFCQPSPSTIDLLTENMTNSNAEKMDVKRLTCGDGKIILREVLVPGLFSDYFVDFRLYGVVAWGHEDNAKSV